MGDTLYLGGIASDGAVVVVARNLVTEAIERTVLARLEPDDHNNPAVVATPGKRLLAFYSRHDADDAVRWRASSRPADVRAWEPERRLRFGGNTTYVQVHPVGDELHVFTRVGDTAWGYAYSPDWGETWSAPVAFVALETDQETYMPTTLLADGRTLRVAIAGHPKNYENRPWHRIGAAVVDLATGAVRLPSDSREIANLRTGAGLPVRGAQLEPVFDAGEGRTLNLFDVGDGPVFEVGFASKVEGDRATADARYHVGRLDADGWSVEQLTHAGTIFGYIHAGFYAGGIAFPHSTPGGVAYVSRERDGVWHLERWGRCEDSTWHARDVFAPSTARVVRPWPVRNPTPDLEVVALLLERYDDDYMETLSHLVGGAAA